MSQEDRSITPYIPGQRGVELRQFIEAKFGPIPEFDNSIWEDLVTEQTVFDFDHLRFSHRYNPHQELLEFTDQSHKGVVDLAVTYKLIDALTKTVARRSLAVYSNASGRKRGQLQLATVSYRLPNYMQHYHLSAEQGNIFGVNFVYGENFPDFNLGAYTGSPLAQIYYSSQSPTQSRTDIQMPTNSLKDISASISRDGFDPSSLATQGTHVFFITRNGEISGDITIAHPQKRANSANLNIEKLDPGVLYAHPDLGSQSFTLTITGRRMEVEYLKHGKPPESWNLQLPKDPDFQSVLAQILGYNWTSLYEIYPVRLNITDLNSKMALPSPGWNPRKLLWWKR